MVGLGSALGELAQVVLVGLDQGAKRSFSRRAAAAVIHHQCQ